MRRILRTTAVAAALLAPAALAPRADAQIRIQFQWGTRDRPLRGQRFETMRALAHELDERTRHALDMVVDTNGRSRQERRLVSSMSDFARRTERFHQRMDAYATRPWEVPPEVQDLRERAMDVNRRFSRVATFQHVADDWQGALDVLNRMLQVLQGYDVPAPQGHGSYGEGGYDRDDHHHDADERYRRDEGFGYGGQNGNVDELRELSRRLMTEARQADDQAGRLESDNPYVGAATGAIHHFAEEVRGVYEQLNRGEVDRGQIQELQRDARNADERVRRAGLSQNLTEWDDVLSIVDRMDQLTR